MRQTIAEQKIEIPYPDAAEASLVLRTGPCRIRFSVTDGPAWIAGSYVDPTGVLPLQIHPGAVTTIAQSLDLSAIGTAELPRLELAFARQRPFALEIQAGASETTFDLGGMPLTKLVLRAGAGKFDVDFAQPNPTTMRAMELSAGAGALSAKRLANARFLTLRVGGGVSASTLDFSGPLVTDATVRIDAGLGSIDVFVPSLTPVRVRPKAFAATVRASGGFSRQGDSYATTPAIQGAHPLLEVEASVAFGALNLVAS